MATAQVYYLVKSLTNRIVYLPRTLQTRAQNCVVIFWQTISVGIGAAPVVAPPYGLAILFTKKKIIKTTQSVDCMTSMCANQALRH